MMDICAVICEYNPFHAGHAAQLRQLRLSRPDAVTVALLSGNFVQRGEAALFPDFLRAQAAIDAGIDLCLSLPVPFSCAPAELFARAGVTLARKIGANTLFFGAETPDLAALTRAADRLSDKAFDSALRDEVRAHSGEGYPAARARLYRAMYGETEAALLDGANNTLALSYILACRDTGITPVVLPRVGAAHDAPTSGGDAVCSASAVRAALRAGNDAPGCPAELTAKYRAWMQAGFAADGTQADAAVLYTLSAMTPQEMEACADVPCGMGARLHRAACTCATTEELYAAVATKKYTSARLRRMVLSCVLGIPHGATAAEPLFTRLLGANARGRACLAEMQPDGLTLLTRTSDNRTLRGAAAVQYTRSERAQRLYRLMLKGAYPLVEQPYIKQ